MTEPLVSGEAFKAMLAHVDPDKKIPELKEQFKAATSISKKDSIIKQIKYYAGLKNTGLEAKDAYILHHIPVVPPSVRPASIMGGNRIEFADVNKLYKDHMLVNSTLSKVKDDLPPEMLTKEREIAYDGVKAIVGLGDAISPDSKARNVKGLIRQISGTGGPKTGLFQNKILSKKQDFSGRATIYAEPDLEFNQAAVPKDMIWTMYKFHILRDLAKQGYDYVNSEKAWQDRNDAATRSFNRVIKNIPMIINRAPTLMKSNILAVYPKPIEGNAMGMNVLHLPFIAGDFDGDALTLHVPMTPEAVSEAKNNLLAQHQVHDYRKGLNSSIVAPGHESIIGSVHMTEPDHSQKTVEFNTEEECLAALKEGTIKENTPVVIRS